MVSTLSGPDMSTVSAKVELIYFNGLRNGARLL